MNKETHKWYRVVYFPHGVESDEWIELVPDYYYEEPSDGDFHFDDFDEADEFMTQHLIEFPEQEDVFVVEETRRIVTKEDV